MVYNLGLCYDRPWGTFIARTSRGSYSRFVGIVRAHSSKPFPKRGPETKMPPGILKNAHTRFVPARYQQRQNSIDSRLRMINFVFKAPCPLLMPKTNVLINYL